MVDDNLELCEQAADWFADHNETFEWVQTGQDAIERLRFASYDVIILDLGLPDMDGVSILRQFRSQGGQTPVLVLTGEADLNTKEAALDSGADDYLTKPFYLRELSARIRALLRRPVSVTQEVHRIADLELNTVTKCVKRGHVEIVLLPREYALLEFLVKHPEQFFLSAALLERVWVSESETSPDAIRVYVTRLRSKIDLPGLQPLLQTQRGFGYRITASGKLQVDQE